MKISAVKPEYRVLDELSPEIEIDVGFQNLKFVKTGTYYTLTYTKSFELSEDEFRKVVNA